MTESEEKETELHLIEQGGTQEYRIVIPDGCGATIAEGDYDINEDQIELDFPLNLNNIHAYAKIGDSWFAAEDPWAISLHITIISSCLVDAWNIDLAQYCTRNAMYEIDMKAFQSQDIKKIFPMASKDDFVEEIYIYFLGANGETLNLETL